METPTQQIEPDPLSKENSITDLDGKSGQQELQLEVVETASNDSEDHVGF